MSTFTNSNPYVSSNRRKGSGFGKRNLRKVSGFTPHLWKISPPSSFFSNKPLTFTNSSLWENKSVKQRGGNEKRNLPKVSGFTLIELLVVIALMAIIGGTILYFLNPAEQYARANNTQRIAHINTIAFFVKSRLTDKHYAFEANCPSGPLPTTTKQMGSGIGNYDIEPCLVPEGYLSVIPLDPVNGTSTAIGYNIIYSTSTKQITVSAPGAELGAVISVTR